MSKLCLLLLVLIPLFGISQSYAPEPGVIGSTAIHKDSSIFVGWASSVSVSRGYMNLLNPGAGFASYGTDSDAIGEPDGLSVVSLGDRGEAIITFDAPIVNGIGPDFAIFENGFTDHYMEFAFVEVSSDGIDFYRFNAVSEAPTDIQLTNFSFSDCRYVHNLAGKYRQLYGTPFDLEELSGIGTLDVNNVNYIRLIDVVGSINASYGSSDSQGSLINDPFPTEFESSGFDLDAVGVIHQGETSLQTIEDLISIVPNPSSGVFNLEVEKEVSYSVYSQTGRIINEGNIVKSNSIDLASHESGIYFLHLESNQGNFVVRLMLK